MGAGKLTKSKVARDPKEVELPAPPHRRGKMPHLLVLDAPVCFTLIIGLPKERRDVVDAGLAQRERQPLQLPFLLARRALVLRERIERSPCVWLSLFACRPDQHPADAAIR